MLLFLDDKRLPPNDAWTLAKTAHEAIELLKTGKVEVISLDHDLGPPEAGTGYDVAKWLEAGHARAARDPDFDGDNILVTSDDDPIVIPNPLWHIHSSNPVGAKNITMALRNLPRLSESMVKGLQLPPEVPALVEPDLEQRAISGDGEALLQLLTSDKFKRDDQKYLEKFGKLPDINLT